MKMPASSSGTHSAANASVDGRTYWRSLDELAATPEFRQWVEREFPEGASEWMDPVSRRHFMKIMSASFLLAGLGLTGCRRPEQRIVPFGKMPEDYVHGVPQYYATAMPAHASAIPLVVRSNDGRPTKIEGNALHPASGGGTDRYAQASILNLYDPDRATSFKRAYFVPAPSFEEGKAPAGRGPEQRRVLQATAPEDAMDFLAQLSRKAQSNGGQGLSFLLERSNSPSRQRLQALLQDKLPQARWYAYEPVDLDIHRRAASEAFGKSVQPRFQLEKANVVVALDCDFLGSEPDVQNNIRRFAERRRLEKPSDSLNRLYVVETLMTVTGFSADHRLRLPSSAVIQVAAALASEVMKQGGGIAGLEKFGNPADVAPKWIAECAKDLLQNRGQSLVVAGHRQPMAVHLLAHALNSALENPGRTVVFHEVPEGKEGGLSELAQALNQGQVETLVILGGNPVYSAPADLDWVKTQGKAKTVVCLGYYEDETAVLSDWHLPAAHYLESWGDARTSDGTFVPIQPLIAPLFGGMTEIEVLARLAGLSTTSPYEIVRETFARLVPGDQVEATWRKVLHDGFLANSAARAVEVKLNDSAVAQALAAFKPRGAPAKDRLEVVFHRDYSLDDGRYNNNGWLQELPDPVTKLVWDNAVLISRKTAEELGVKNSDLVEIKLGERSVRGPIWIQPGFADYSLGLALGYGRERTGRVGRGTGFNAYALRTRGSENFATGATLRRTGQTYALSGTQGHWSLEGRAIVREADLEQYRRNPKFACQMGEEQLPVEAPLYPNPLDQVEPKALHAWGMSIDLNLCVGCSACMLACQSENNVPIVGKDQVHRGREMHWLRIDRYYSGRPLAPQGSPQAKAAFFEKFETENQQQFQRWIDEPQTVVQPMLCQHCEAAPCENVCPVNATSHDHEGLNLMTYNRCVGTRYCSNNCPYKVRRFNFFDYNKRPLDKLYLGPLATRPADEWDLVAMLKNPDVTVRMRGVMEKCTFCVQRIEGAKIAQKTKAGASGDVVVPTDSFTTACAQACPSGAIVFGNLKDPESRVSKRKRLDRDYTVLEPLFTRPRTTYLARVRNPNPAMPDYDPRGPLSLQEYEQSHGALETPHAPTEPAKKEAL